MSPATSVYSDQCIIENGNIFDEKRSHLLATCGEMLLFIHHNGNKINNAYDVEIK